MATVKVQKSVQLTLQDPTDLRSGSRSRSLPIEHALKPPGSYSVKMTAYMRKAYTYNIQLQRTQQTAHSACSVCHVVNISGTAESGYSCIETNTMSQARRPFTLENLSFHNTTSGGCGVFYSAISTTVAAGSC